MCKFYKKLRLSYRDTQAGISGNENSLQYRHFVQRMNGNYFVSVELRSLSMR